jgi:demethylmenaquinone methyltransferase / 2-methoxy-6-polyprenyl-1,4-benzoquinol methylase
MNAFLKATLPSSTTTLDKSGEKIRRMFAQIAPRYDRLNQILSLNIDRSWRRRVVDRLRLQPGLPVLDVCTGTGDLAIEIARRHPHQFPVIGTDFCLPMLELALPKAKQAGHELQEISFMEADTEKLPFEDNTFQAVTVAFGIRNVSDTSAGIQEMIRVCRPGGQIAILEFSKPTLFGLRQLYEGYFRFVLPAIGQAMAKNSESAYQYLPASVQQFPSGPAMLALMESIGLTDCQAYPLTFGVATIYLGTKAFN